MRSKLRGMHSVTQTSMRHALIHANICHTMHAMYPKDALDVKGIGLSTPGLQRKLTRRHCKGATGGCQLL